MSQKRDDGKQHTDAKTREGAVKDEDKARTEAQHRLKGLTTNGPASSATASGSVAHVSDRSQFKGSHDKTVAPDRMHDHPNESQTTQATTVSRDLYSSEHSSQQYAPTKQEQATAPKQNTYAQSEKNPIKAQLQNPEHQAQAHQRSHPEFQGVSHQPKTQKSRGWSPAQLGTAGGAVASPGEALPLYERAASTGRLSGHAEADNPQTEQQDPFASTELPAGFNELEQEKHNLCSSMHERVSSSGALKGPAEPALAQQHPTAANVTVPPLPQTYQYSEDSSEGIPPPLGPTKWVHQDLTKKDAQPKPRSHAIHGESGAKHDAPSSSSASAGAAKAPTASTAGVTAKPPAQSQQFSTARDASDRKQSEQTQKQAPRDTAANTMKPGEMALPSHTTSVTAPGNAGEGSLKPTSSESSKLAQPQALPSWHDAPDHLDSARGHHVSVSGTKMNMFESKPTHPIQSEQSLAAKQGTVKGPLFEPAPTAVQESAIDKATDKRPSDSVYPGQDKSRLREQAQEAKESDKTLPKKPEEAKSDNKTEDKSKPLQYQQQERKAATEQETPPKKPYEATHVRSESHEATSEKAKEVATTVAETLSHGVSEAAHVVAAAAKSAWEGLAGLAHVAKEVVTGEPDPQVMQAAQLQDQDKRSVYFDPEFEKFVVDREARRDEHDHVHPKQTDAAKPDESKSKGKNTPEGYKELAKDITSLKHAKNMERDTSTRSTRKSAQASIQQVQTNQASASQAQVKQAPRAQSEAEAAAVHNPGAKETNHQANVPTDLHKLAATRRTDVMADANTEENALSEELASTRTVLAANGLLASAAKLKAEVDQYFREIERILDITDTTFDPAAFAAASNKVEARRQAMRDVDQMTEELLGYCSEMREKALAHASSEHAEFRDNDLLECCTECKQKAFKLCEALDELKAKVHLEIGFNEANESDIAQLRAREAALDVGLQTGYVRGALLALQESPSRQALASPPKSMGASAHVSKLTNKSPSKAPAGPEIAKIDPHSGNSTWPADEMKKGRDRQSKVSRHEGNEKKQGQRENVLGPKTAMMMERAVHNSTSSVTQAVDNATQYAKDTFKDASRNTREFVSDAAKSVQTTASDARRALDNAATRAQNAADSVAYKAQDAANQFVDTASQTAAQARAAFESELARQGRYRQASNQMTDQDDPLWRYTGVPTSEWQKDPNAAAKRQWEMIAAAAASAATGIPDNYLLEDEELKRQGLLSPRPSEVTNKLSVRPEVQRHHMMLQQQQQEVRDQLAEQAKPAKKGLFSGARSWFRKKVENVKETFGFKPIGLRGPVEIPTGPAQQPQPLQSFPETGAPLAVVRPKPADPRMSTHEPFVPPEEMAPAVRSAAEKHLVEVERNAKLTADSMQVHNRDRIIEDQIARAAEELRKELGLAKGETPLIQAKLRQALAENPRVAQYSGSSSAYPTAYNLMTAAKVPALEGISALGAQSPGVYQEIEKDLRETLRESSVRVRDELLGKSSVITSPVTRPVTDVQTEDITVKSSPTTGVTTAVASPGPGAAAAATAAATAAAVADAHRLKLQSLLQQADHLAGRSVIQPKGAHQGMHAQTESSATSEVATPTIRVMRENLGDDSYQRSPMSHAMYGANEDIQGETMHAPFTRNYLDSYHFTRDPAFATQMLPPSQRMQQSQQQESGNILTRAAESITEVVKGAAEKAEEVANKVVDAGKAAGDVVLGKDPVKAAELRAANLVDEARSRAMERVVDSWLHSDKAGVGMGGAAAVGLGARGFDPLKSPQAFLNPQDRPREGDPSSVAGSGRFAFFDSVGNQIASPEPPCEAPMQVSASAKGERPKSSVEGFESHRHAPGVEAAVHDMVRGKTKPLVTDEDLRKTLDSIKTPTFVQIKKSPEEIAKALHPKNLADHVAEEAVSTLDKAQKWVREKVHEATEVFVPPSEPAKHVYKPSELHKQLSLETSDAVRESLGRNDSLAAPPGGAAATVSWTTLPTGEVKLRSINYTQPLTITNVMEDNRMSDESPALRSIQTGAPNLATKVVETGKAMADKATELVDKTKQASAIMDKARKVKDSIEDATRLATDVGRQAKQVADQVVDEMKSKVARAMERETSQAKKDSTRLAGSEAKRATEEAAKGIDSLKLHAKEGLEHTKQQFLDAKKAVHESAQHFKQGAQHAGEYMRDAAENVSENIAHQASQAKTAAQDAARRAGQHLESTAEHASQRVGEINQSIKSGVDRAKESAQTVATQAHEKAAGAGQAIQETAKGAAHGAKEKAQQIGHTVQDATLQAKHKAEEAAAAAKQKVSEAGHTIQDSATAAKRKAEDLGMTAKQRASELGHSIQDSATAAKHKAEDLAAAAKEKATNAGHTIQETAQAGGRKVQQLATTARNKAAEVGHTVQETATAAKSKAQDLAAAAKDKVADAAHTVKDAAITTQHKIQDAAAAAREKTATAGHVMQETAQTAKHRAEELAAAAGDKVKASGHTIKEAAQTTKHKAQELAAAAGERAQEAGHTVQEAAQIGKHKTQELAAAARDKAYEAGHTVADAASQMKHKVEDIASAAKSKTQTAAVTTKERAQEVAAAAQEKVTGAGQAIKEKAQDVAVAAKEKAQAAGTTLQTAAHNAKHKAEEVASTAKTKAAEAGHAIAEKASGAVAATKETAANAAERVKDAAVSAKDKAASLASAAGATVSEAATAAKEKASDIASASKEKAVEAGHTISEAAAGARDKAKEMASQTGHTVSEIASAAKEKATEAGHVVQEAAAHAGHAIHDAAVAAKDKVVSAAGWLFEKVTGAAENAASAISEASQNAAEHVKQEAKSKTGHMMEREDASSFGRMSADTESESGQTSEEFDDEEETSKRPTIPRALIGRKTISRRDAPLLEHVADPQDIPHRAMRPKQYKKTPKQKKAERRNKHESKVDSLSRIDAPKAAVRNPDGDWETKNNRTAYNISKDLKGPFSGAFMMEREGNTTVTTTTWRSPTGYETKEAKTSESKSGLLGSLSSWFTGKPTTTSSLGGSSSSTTSTMYVTGTKEQADASKLVQLPGTTTKIITSTTEIPVERTITRTDAKRYADSDAMVDEIVVEGPAHTYTTTASQSTVTRTKLQVEPEVATTTVTIPADVTFVTTVTKPPEIAPEPLPDLVTPALEKVAQTEAQMERIRRHALEAAEHVNELKKEVTVTTQALKDTADRAAFDVEGLREDLRRATEEARAARAAASAAAAEVKRRLEAQVELFKNQPAPVSTTTATIRLHEDALKAQTQTIPGKLRKVTEVITSPTHITTLEDGKTKSTVIVPNEGVDTARVVESAAERVAHEMPKKETQTIATTSAPQVHVEPHVKVAETRPQVKAVESSELLTVPSRYQTAATTTTPNAELTAAQRAKLQEIQESIRLQQLQQSPEATVGARQAEVQRKANQVAYSEQQERPGWFRRVFGNLFGLNYRDPEPQPTSRYTIYPQEREAERIPASFALNEAGTETRARTRSLEAERSRNEQLRREALQATTMVPTSTGVDLKTLPVTHGIVTQAPYVPNPVIGETEVLNLREGTGFVRGIATPALAVTTTRTYTPGIIIQPAETPVETTSDTVIETATVAGLTRRYPLATSEAASSVARESSGGWLRGWSWGSDRGSADSNRLGSGAFANRTGFWDSGSRLTPSEVERILANRHLPDPIHDKVQARDTVGGHDYLAAQGELIRTYPEYVYDHPGQHGNESSARRLPIVPAGSTAHFIPDVPHASQWVEAERAIRAKAEKIAENIAGNVAAVANDVARKTGLDKDLIDLDV